MSPQARAAIGICDETGENLGGAGTVEMLIQTAGGVDQQHWIVIAGILAVVGWLQAANAVMTWWWIALYF